MGLFSRRHASTRKPQQPDSKLYVFIRDSGTSQTAPTTTTTWSIAISQDTNHPSSDRHSGSKSKSKISSSAASSLFSLHSRRPSTSSNSSSPPSDDHDERDPKEPSHEEITEFPLSPNNNATTTTTPSHPHLLLKILLPTSSTSSFSPSSIPSHLPNPNSNPAPTSSLHSLQTAHILPPPPLFSAPHFLAFADLHLAAFRRDVGHGGHGGEAVATREVDYAAQVAENLRLRGLFGHGDAHGVERERERERDGKREGEWTHGKWWVSRPGEAQGGRRTETKAPRVVSTCGERPRDVYGGLM